MQTPLSPLAAIRICHFLHARAERRSQMLPSRKHWGVVVANEAKVAGVNDCRRGTELGLTCCAVLPPGRSRRADIHPCRCSGPSAPAAGGDITDLTPSTPKAQHYFAILSISHPRLSSLRAKTTLTHSPPSFWLVQELGNKPLFHPALKESFQRTPAFWFHPYFLSIYFGCGLLTHKGLGERQPSTPCPSREQHVGCWGFALGSACAGLFPYSWLSRQPALFSLTI